MLYNGIIYHAALGKLLGKFAEDLVYYTDDNSENYSENLRKIWYIIQTITRKITRKI
jgi:hypothetical protein